MKKILFILLVIISSSHVLFSAERVSLSLDKDAYLLGDTLKFEVSLSSDETVKSKVLYVELLAPEGYVADRQILQLRGDNAIGTIVMRTGNRSGLFELRAYTRYGLSQDKDNYASKVFPVCEWENGCKAMLDRRRKAFKQKEEPIMKYHVTQEQGITVRGRLVDYLDRPYKKASLPVIISLGGKSFRVMTDDEGQFDCELGNVTGRGKMTVVYDYRQVSEKKKPRILLDRTFSPIPRAYTPREDSLANDYDIITTNHSRDAFHPSMWFSMEDIANNYVDSEDYRGKYDGKDASPDLVNSLFYMLSDIGYFSGDAGVRFVDFYQPWSHADSLYEHRFSVHEGFQLNEQLDDFQRVFVSTDTNFCHKVSYEKYDPNTLKGNKFKVETEITGGISDDDEGTFLGINHKEGSGGMPSVVVCLIPYPKDTPLSEKASFHSPYIRRVTFHGFSKK